jgi:hypothetical protein
LSIKDGTDSEEIEGYGTSGQQVLLYVELLHPQDIILFFILIG